MNRSADDRSWQVPVLLGLALLCLLAPACGTLLYPERHGQEGGEIDLGVVLLDGIGVILWVVPGLIAFIVDFSTGAIYESGPAAQVEDAVDG